MYAATEDEALSSERVHLFLQGIQIEEELDTELAEEVSIKTKRGLIRGRTPNQRIY